jgi:multiple sugar transport system substrate-binding protein
MTAMIDEFERQNPDIKVNLTDLTWANGHEKIVLAFASGSAPDVVELGSDWIAQFADAGQIKDLTTHADSLQLEFQGWSMASYQDKVWAQPWILGTRVLYYNRELGRRAGIPDDFAPLSWNELRGASGVITALDPEIYGWGSNTAEKHRLYKKFMPFFWSARGQMLSDDGRYCVVSSQQAVKALEFYKDLHDESGYVASQRGIEDAFLDGKVGFVLSGDWLLKRIELENRSIDFSTSTMPGPGSTFGSGRSVVAGYKNETYPGRSFMGGEYLAISAASKHPDAALKLISFVTSPENQIKFCKANRSANPSSRTAQADAYFQDNINLRTFVMQLHLSDHPPVDPDWVYMEAELERAVEQVLFENAPPGETLLQLQKTITELRQK